MRGKKSHNPRLSMTLLLLAVLSALFAIFSLLLTHRADSGDIGMSRQSIIPIQSQAELDLELKNIRNDDFGKQLDNELRNLNSESKGI